MAKRVVAVIHDDWEIRGQGLGNVAHHQYLPSLVLMQVARRLGIRLTFMVELGQQLAFLRFGDQNPDLALQAHLWEESVRLMRYYGFDVQPHIHPHWFQSHYADGYVHVKGSWNLATYEAPARKAIIGESFTYLRDLMAPLPGDWSLSTFKAGSHALQPSRGILGDLMGEGVRLVMGPRQGLKTINPEFAVDYRHLEEATLPYCPNLDDVTRVGANLPLAVLPLTYWDLDWTGRWWILRRRLGLSRFLCRTPNPHPYHFDVPQAIASLNPRVDESAGTLRNRLGLGRQLGLNLGGPKTYGEQRHILDGMMQRLLEVDSEIVPLVIESHTKDYPGNYEPLEQFLVYMQDRYGDVLEFMTATEFVRLLDAAPELVRHLP